MSQLDPMYRTDEDVLRELRGKARRVVEDTAYTNGHAGDGAIEAPFWHIDKKSDAARIDHSALVDWLEDEGFAKLYEFDQETSTRVRRDGRILDRQSDEQIKDYVLGHARRHADRRPLDALRKASNIYCSPKVYECLQVLHPSFLRDEKDVAYVTYRNGVAVVTADGVRLEPFAAIPGFLWRESIIDRMVEIRGRQNEDFTRHDFGRFAWLAMAQDLDRMRAFMSALGYLMHEYKNRAEAKAIIFLDQVISDDPAGRSGKGLTMQAVSHIRPTVEVDARRLDLDNTFAFQDVVPGVTRILYFNDASERFAFDRLFAAITDNMAVERKGQQRISIPFADSPKFVISTNYVIKGHGGSHDDRVFELEFSDHFNQRHSPRDEFGRLLFDEWDAAQWNAFDNFMLRCIQMYLAGGLLPYEPVNLAWKKFQAATSYDFADFVQVVEFEANAPATSPIQRVMYQKRDLQTRFAGAYGQDISKRQLTLWLNAYAEYRGWEIINRLGAEKDHVAFVDHSSGGA